MPGGTGKPPGGSCAHSADFRGAARSSSEWRGGFFHRGRADGPRQFFSRQDFLHRLFQAGFNEAPYARMVAQRFGTEHHELMVEPHLSEALDALTRSLEEPFGDSSMIPTYYICRLARQHVTVALSGDGGDELFAGYERYGFILRKTLGDYIPSFLGRWYRQRIFRLLPSGIYGRNFIYNRSM